MTLLHETLAIALAAAPWLLLGLLAAGLVKALLPEALLRRWLGGQGLGAVSRAAVVGAPLPLCSCGAIPTAIALHRGGAGRGPTTAFLVSTPGIGVDSLTITYALLGPFMVLARAGGAVVTAIGTGLLVGAAPGAGKPRPADDEGTCDACCAGDCETAAAAGELETSLGTRLLEGQRYAFSDVLDDISTWLLVGLVVAGVMITLIPPQTLAAYGSGLLPMLFMALIGIPMYICATAATPVAAALLLAGVSPGTVLVFLLAGPITSMATLGALRREMGNAVLARYLSSIVVSSVLLGLLVDLLVTRAGLDIAGQMGVARELLPRWLEWVALAALAVLAVQPLRRALFRI
jgi:uncharacterized protein